MRAIAVGIGRSAATVSRELRRDGPEPTVRRLWKYAPYAAQKRAELRGRWPKASKFDTSSWRPWCNHKLCVKWSPEQISLHLAESFPERAEMRVCAETDLPVVNGAVIQAVERQIRALVGVPACLVDIEFNAQTGLLTGV